MITDEYMKQMLATTKNYSIIILKSGPQWGTQGAMEIIWEHGRRNFELREQKVLSIVCPISDDTEVKGLCIFNADVEKSIKIMNDDPAIKAGVLSFEVHASRSFPGDTLPQ